MTDSKTHVRKKLIGKKSPDDTHKERDMEKRLEESIEIPLSKVLGTFAVLLVIALVVALALNADKLKGIFNQDVAATVNGEEITWSQIDKKYETVPESMRTYITKETLLNQTINELVIKQEVEKRDIVVDEAYLNVMVDNVKDQFPDEKTFNETLVSYGISYQELVDQLELSLKLNKMLEMEFPILKVNESEIESFFEENKESLSVPEQVKASHILVNDSNTADEIIEKLDDGEDFAELAEEYSIDTASAVYGGELGYFSRGMMIAEFEEAAFEMEIGEISEPVKTIYGYHIIKLTDRKAQEEAKLDDKTRVLIDLNIFNQKWDQNTDMVNEFLSSLYESAEIKLNN